MAGVNIPELYLGSRWLGTTITYSFLEDFPTYPAGPPGSRVRKTSGQFNPFLAAEQEETQRLLDYISTITGITFTKVEHVPATSQVGDITFGYGAVPGGYGGITEAAPGADLGGDIYISNDLAPSLFSQTLLHELGHALGLDHPGIRHFGPGPVLARISHTVFA